MSIVSKKGKDIAIAYGAAFTKAILEGDSSAFEEYVQAQSVKQQLISIMNFVLCVYWYALNSHNSHRLTHLFVLAFKSF